MDIHVVHAKLDLPIGQYSEEEQEAQNKELRNARLNHSSKVSRLTAMANQFHYMLIKTDPRIAPVNFVKETSSNRKPLPLEALLMQK